MNIEEAINNTDFIKISAAMHILDWKYAMSENSPTPDELKDTVRELASDMEPIVNETVSKSTGGLTVSITTYDDAPDSNLIRFTITSNHIIDNKVEPTTYST